MYCKEKMCCEPKYDCCEGHYPHHYHEYDMCCTPKMKCKTERECVKTYKCYYKLYKYTTYKMHKCCQYCGHEYDVHYHHMCPKCGQY